jgi:amidase
METLGSDPTAFEVLVKFTAPFNTTGSPTMTFPAGFTPKGTPVAMQVVGRHLDEALLVRATRAFQRVTDWHRRHPSMTGRR